MPHCLKGLSRQAFTNTSTGTMHTYTTKNIRLPELPFPLKTKGISPHSNCANYQGISPHSNCTNYYIFYRFRYHPGIVILQNNWSSSARSRICQEKQSWSCWGQPRGPSLTLHAKICEIHIRYRTCITFYDLHSFRWPGSLTKLQYQPRYQHQAPTTQFIGVTFLPGLSSCWRIAPI